VQRDAVEDLLEELVTAVPGVRGGVVLPCHLWRRSAGFASPIAAKTHGGGM
jgi:hypothetical protein